MPLTDAQRRARGEVRLVTWQSADTVRKLDELVEDSGYTRGELIETMIQADHETLVANRRVMARTANKR